jgi:hypothetical protein
MRFEPPDAAMLTRVKEGSSNAQALAAASASKRKKLVAGSAAAATQAAIQAAAKAAAGMVYPISVDGTVVEVLDEFRWASNGASAAEHPELSCLVSFVGFYHV